MEGLFRETAICRSGWALIEADVSFRVRVPKVRHLHVPQPVSRRMSRTRAVLVALVVLGVFLRLATFPSWGLVYDGSEYAVMGKSLLDHGEFLRPAVELTYYRHYGPLFPAYLSVFYAFFGFSVAVTKAAELILSFLFIAVVYATTRDLYGRSKAWFAAAFVSVEPIFFITSAIGYSESLVGLLFVGTVWAVLKGLGQPRYLVLAGTLAGLGYLAKAPIGYVFVIAGAAGLLWRLRFRGWRVLRDPWYLGGMGAFALLVGGWTLRNLARYGWPNWETSAVLDTAYTFGLAHPGILVTGLLEKLPWFLLIFLFYGGLFLPELRRSWRRVREEATSALWLAVGLIFVMGWIVSAFFWTVEHTPIWWHDNLRYVSVGAPVLLWAAMREVSPFAGAWAPRRPSLWSFRSRFFVLIGVFLVVNLMVVAFPAPYSHIEAVQAIDRVLQAGDSVALDGLSPELVLPYLTVPGVDLVLYRSGFNGTFVLSATSTQYTGFVLMGSYRGQDLTGWSYATRVWARASALAEGRVPSV